MGLFRNKDARAGDTHQLQPFTPGLVFARGHTIFLLTRIKADRVQQAEYSSIRVIQRSGQRFRTPSFLLSVALLSVFRLLNRYLQSFFHVD